MSEFDWIAKYFAPLAIGAGAAGLNDDVAVLGADARIVTVDALVEGVHFLSDDPIESVASKLVRVNVSDLIAKGALPREALLTLGWPGGRDEEELERFARALGEELHDWQALLIGGDTVRSPGGLFVSLTLTGVPAGPRAPVRRSGADIGDEIWVSGQIGAGVLGLKAARAGDENEACRRYRCPAIPPLALAEVIAREATASMDVSDGLIGDLQKLLLASGCGGRLSLENVPYFEEPADSEAALIQATGGDDYQCLFTLPAGRSDQLDVSGVKLTRIGQVEAGRGLRLSWHETALDMPKRTGFQHT